MSINKIDILLDNVIDDFYLSIINKKKIISKITNDGENLAKHQQYILDIIHKYLESINRIEIKNLVTLEDNVDTIIKCIGKYISYYLFLQIKSGYKGSEKTFVNNLLEMCKNKSNYNIQIDGFFDSVSTRNIIELMILIDQINELLDSNEKKIENLSKNDTYHKAFKLLNNIGKDSIEKYFKSTDKLRNMHSIIKTIILLLIYSKHEKKELSQIIEDAINNKEEYIYIDVIVSKNLVITYDTIEKILTEKERKNNVAGILYDLIQKETNITNILAKNLSTDDKISNLLNSKLVVPIVDNFVLYHKDSEKYESQKSSMKLDEKKQQLTKVKYIVDKIDSMAKYNSADIETKEKIDKEWYLPMVYSKYMLINHYENVSIFNKIMTAERITDNYEYYHDFYEYFFYPYVNFKDTRENAFRINLDRNINMVRIPSNNNNIHWLTASENKQIDIVGFLFKPSNIPIQCVDLCDNCFINDTEKNAYKTFIERINYIISHKGNKFKPFVWLFDDNMEFQLESYESQNNLSKSEISKLVTAQIYDQLEEITYFIIEDYLNSQKYMTIQFSNSIVQIISKSLLKINEHSERYIKLQKLIASKAVPVLSKEDDFENKIIKSANIIKLHGPQKPKEINTVRVLVKNKETNNKNNKQSDLIDKYVCQHNITWNNITAIKRSNPNKFVGILEDFMKRYVIVSDNSEYYCKSCGFNINLKEYDVDGNFDSETGQFKAFGFSLTIALEELPEYKNYKKVIQNIDSKIEKIAFLLNIQLFYGKNQVGRRSILVKSIIDTIIENNRSISNHNKINEFNGVEYGISKGTSEEFKTPFDLNDLIYTDTANKGINNLKKNLIIAYIIVSIILELNDSHILLLKLGSKICNSETFDTNTKQLLEKNKIFINKSLDTTNINDHIILSYIIYYFSCNIVKYDLWYFNFEEKDRNKSLIIKMKMKIVMEYILVTMNSIIYAYSLNHDSQILTNFVYKYFIRLHSVYNKDKSLSSLKRKSSVQINTDPDMISKQFDLFTDYRQKSDIKVYINQRHSYLVPLKRKEIKASNIDEVLINNKLNNMRNKIKYDNSFKFICNLLEKNKTDVCKKIINNTADKKDYLEYLEYVKMFSVTDIFELQQYDKLIESYSVKEKIIQDLENTFNKDYSKENNTSNKLITLFITKVKSITGNTDFDSSIVELERDRIEIIRDHQGHYIKKPIIVKDDLENPKLFKNEISNEETLPLFKSRKILVYNISGKIDVMYDKITNVIIGYKDVNKIFEPTKNGIALHIDHCIKNKLKYLGFSQKNCSNISINNIFINRISNLKNIILQIKRLYNTIFYKSDKFSRKQEDEISLEDDFIKTYKSKLRSYGVKNFLLDLKSLSTISPTYKDDSKFTEIQSHIDVSDIIDYDRNGNMLLFYFINEIVLLIDSYDNRIAKINIINFITDAINYMYNDTSKEQINNTLELKQFKYRLESSGYIYDNEDIHYLQESDDNVTDFYGNSTDSDAEIDKESQLDDQEEIDAIDVDGEFDYEGNFEVNDK